MIGVWLKVMNRPNMDAVYSTLDYWLEAFSAPKYDVWIYNENIDNLPEKYQHHKQITRKLIAERSECQTITNLINATPWIADKWKGACFALSVPYWFLDADFVWNIDADDLKLEKDAPIKHYIEQVEDRLQKLNALILSSDIYWCVNHQWSFGIAFANRREFAAIIKNALNLHTYEPGWGRNLDHQIHEYFRLILPQESPISFTTPHRFEHCGDINTGLCSWFDMQKKHSACSLYGKRVQYALKEAKCLLIA